MTGRFALLIAVTAPVVLLFPDDAWVVAAVLGGGLVAVWAGDRSQALKPSQIAIRRHIPSSVSLGGTGSISWTVVNNGKRSGAIGFAESFTPSLGAARRRFGFELDADRSVSVSQDFTPDRRGRFELGEIVIRTTGPLGLAVRQQKRRKSEEVKVLPRFRSRTEAELKVRRVRLDIGTRSARTRGAGSDFEQLREYSVDDQFRHIDWAATARSNQAIVRTYRSERNQTVINVLDNGRLMATQVAGVPRMEHAIDAIMALTTVATGLNDRAGLLAFDRSVRTVVPASSQRGQLARVTNALFDLDPDLTESDYEGAFREILSRFARRTMIVLHTDLAEAAVVEALLPALGLLARSHVVVVAAVRDVEVERWAGESPEHPDEAYRHVAAKRVLQQRVLTVARLRKVGAEVIDATPDDLAPLLMDHYLRVKSSGAL